MCAGTAKIFLVGPTGESLSPLVETPYEKEDHLQEFLAQCPDLLPGDQIGDLPCRWLLVKREMEVSDGANENRFSLDHLFLDQNGVPTFVECKRSSDTRGRREVVAQMLEYAANGVAYWSPQQIRASAEDTCKAAKTTLDAELARLLEVDEANLNQERIDGFWAKVADNLAESRIRLIFVADQIGPELKRLVVFLNEQMTTVEVLALEIKQFQGEAGPGKVLVPALIGATERAQSVKEAGGRGRVSPESFLNACTPPAQEFYRQLFAVAEDCGATIKWGTVGCSIRLPDSANKLHSLAYCFPPSSFYFNLDDQGVPSPAVKDQVRSVLNASGVVRDSGKSVVYGIVEDRNTPALLSVFREVADMVRNSLAT